MRSRIDEFVSALGMLLVLATLFIVCPLLLGQNSQLVNVGSTLTQRPYYPLYGAKVYGSTPGQFLGVANDYTVVGVPAPTNHPANWRGAWASSGTTYAIGDAVSYSGSSYLNLTGSNGTPSTDTTDWGLLAAAGAAGSMTAAATQNLADAYFAQGRNLLDPNRLGTIGGVLNADGSVWNIGVESCNGGNDGECNFVSNYFPVIPGQPYVSSLVTNHMGSGHGWNWYDANRSFLSETDGNNIGVPVTAPAGAVWGRASLYYNNSGAVPTAAQTAAASIIAIGSSTPLYRDFDYIGPTQLLNQWNILKSHWNGKRLCVQGDSITQFGSGQDPGGWQLPLAHAYNMTMQIDNGVSGATMVSLFTNSSYTSVMTSTTIQNCDVLLIADGVNDFLQNVTLGALGDTTAASFYGGTDLAINTYLTWKPTLRLGFLTPLYCGGTGSGSTSSCGVYQTTATTPNGQGHVLLDYVNAIIAEAAKYQIPYIDLYNKSGFNKFSILSLAGDGLHPNTAGYQFYTPLIVGEFARF